MAKKLIILAPSVGGKSTLMRYLRKNTDLHVYEMDEEVMSANNNKWPSDNKYKDEVLVPKIVRAIIEKPEAIYLASYVPEDLLKEARDKGFRTILINVSLAELKKRNKKRMEVEEYSDSTPWLQLQLKSFNNLAEKGLIDTYIDGQQDTQSIASEVMAIKINGADSELLQLTNKLVVQHFNEPLVKAIQIKGMGQVNTVYELITATHKAILRLNTTEEFDRFQKERWCIETTLAQGVPGARLLALGKTDNFAYMLLDFIEGENGKTIKSDTNLWEILGKQLRLIHETPVKGFGESLNDIRSGNLQQWRDYLTYNIESLTAGDELIKIGVLNNSTSGKLKNIFQNLAQKDFKFGLNHGDYSLANVIVGSQSTAHIIDWGSAQAHIVPHHDLSVILDESLDEDSGEFKALLKGYGISGAFFNDIKQDIGSLHLLETTDKLRWAIDKAPKSIEPYKAKLTKSLRSNGLLA